MAELTEKEIDAQATEQIKRQVKSWIVGKGYTLETLANALNNKYHTRESKANLSNKLSRGSLRYMDVLRILDVLGYSIEIK